MNAKRLIVVVGMHRSGTSAVTRGLQVMGVELGDRMMPPAAGNNSKGFWEDIDLNALNIQMLDAINRDWSHLTPIEAKDVETLRNEGYFLRAAELLHQKVNGVAIFGFKDPRVAKLLPFWKEVFNHCKFSVSYVIAIRHPLSVVKSLAKRDGIAEEQSYLLWLGHVITALVGSTGDKRVLVDYDRLMQSPDCELTRIATCMDLKNDHAKLQSYKTEFLDQGLRHTVYELRDLLLDKACPPIVREVYDSLLDVASDQVTLDDQALQNKVSHWSDEFERIKSPLMLVDRLFTQKLIATQAVTERDSQIAGLNQSVAERDGQIASLNQAVAERDGQIASLNQAVAERDGQIASLNQAVAERDGQIANQIDEVDRMMIEKDGEISNLRQQLNQVLHSRTWRVTAPWRKVAEFVRQGVRLPCLLVPEKTAENSRIWRNNHQDEVIAEADNREITTGDNLLRASLETPATSVLESNIVRFSGWCSHPQCHILELSLNVGMESHLCKYGLERPDVAQVLIGWPAAERSGFEVMIHVPLGSHPMRLDALLDNGQMVSIPIETTLVVRSPAVKVLMRRKLGMAARFARFSYASAREWHKARGRLPTLNEIPRLVAKAGHMFRQRDVAGGSAILPPSGFRFPAKEELYVSWLRYNQWNRCRHTELLDRLLQLKCSPLISVVMPVYNPPLEFLEIAIESVKKQVYSNWELCIADDCSTEPAVRNYLKSVAAVDSRIKLVFLEKNVNISHATNSAVELTTGDFVAFLDNDDELTPDALAEVALYIDSNPNTDYLYSDDDKIDKSGYRFAPQFKPDWSPELLLSYMYCSHLVVVRRSLYHEVGGMRMGFEGSQDYDFALRATERARQIGHIPRVLYHWRVLPGSTAQSGNAKPASIGAGLRAVQEALDRRGVIAKAVQPAWATRDGLGIFAVDFPDYGPSVTVVIPTKNSLEVLKACIDSLRCTTYRDYDVTIIDNESDDPATLTFLAQCGHRVLRIPNPPGGFNYAYINNRAVAETSSDFVLFLNNDTEVKEPKWLSRMVGYAQFPGVGAVGARLLYPDGRIQHAGIVHGYYKGMVGPAHKLLPTWHNGYLSYAAVSRNYLAVTAACLLIQKRLFEEIGCFDEKEFGIAYNDIDLCYRLVDKGYRSVYSAGSELVHYEGHSRGFEDKPTEEAAFKRKYGHLVDPYYNRNLTLEHEQFDVLPRASELAHPARPIRALMIAFNLNLEGAPFSQYELTVGLKRLGAIDPVVYCPEDGPLRALYEEAGIDVIVKPHPLRGVFNIDGYEVAIRGFTEMIRALSVQLVYGNTLQTFYAIDAAHRLGLPSIWNPRESEPWQTYFANFGDQIAVKALECFTYPYRVIFVADATRLGCESLNTANNFTTIHNGLDPKRAESEKASYTRDRTRGELGVGDDELMVLLLGTVCDRKGQIDLVHAVQKLVESETMHRLRFFIVGDRKSAYSERIHLTLDQLPHEVRTRITVVEETRKTALYLSAADIFVCTSRVESYPRVILEAMYYGLAIVTTPVYGIAEQLNNRISALFYPPGDVAQLADHLERLATDHELRARISTNAYLRLCRLTSFEEMLRQYADHFEGAYYSVAPTNATGLQEMRSNRAPATECIPE